MLDTTTKARIDSARDILVGKVPDPKSQVEQITIALIYKFMDDMDRQSEEMSGKATFFTGEFKKYAWNKLLDSRIGGHERLLLYAEGIEKMNGNKNIPQLFRDIFKGAFLPYRDPETLNLFLKEINGFAYDHSERLGDAFEYFLSVLGSQGEAGQFRTPRHIIDFIVEVVGPQKHETVLDPACGTAGFLISAYKHIVAANTKERRGDRLTTDERGRLMSNIRGYDISPDMVRLSRANLYLHGFANPSIHEYDTLTSVERWDERYDVILANPPFMSPTGGIRPHNRFSIKATRSEVLFVDYIAEHLNPGGRAGIIVPEGIIFQSQNAYRALRKMLIENYLWAVVSLPAGVFNPYSGVKTSILLLDKNLAKRTDEVLFIKVENDGYDLGAQRREIEKNDLLIAQKILKLYREKHKAPEDKMTLCVSRTRLLESPDCSFSGDRYREIAPRGSSKWPSVRLGDVCEFTSGLWKSERQPLKKVYILRNTNFEKDGTLNFDDVAEHPVEGRMLPEKLLVPGDILLEKSGGGPLQPVGRVAIFLKTSGEYSFSNFTARMRVVLDHLLPKFTWEVLHCLYSKGITERLQKQTSGIRNLDLSAYKNIEFPLPPLDVQEKIIAELDGYRKIIEGARQIVDNYKPTIRIDPKWPIKPLGEVITLQRGYDLPKTQFIKGTVPVVGSNGIIGYHNVAKEKGPGVVTGRSGTIGKVHFIDYDYYWPHNTALFVKEFNDNERKYIKYLLESIDLKSLGDNVAAVPSLDRKNAHRILVPIPPLNVQRSIVAELDAEQALIESNRKLIEIFEKKIQDKLSEIWGETKHG